MPHSSSRVTPRLRICLVDMNNGVANQATRCFRRLVDSFSTRVKEKNPNLDVVFKHVQPRNLGELPDNDADIILSSGGPGAPTDGFDDPWGVGYRNFLDYVAAKNARDPVASPKLFAICHSFQLAVLHFGVARMQKRASCKFGLMPVYMTEPGQRIDYLAPFGYRLFAWEHRNWEAVDIDDAKLAKLGGELLAKETADGGVDKGRAALAMRFAPGIHGTQFHPGADSPGVMSWVEKPESKVALTEAYGVFLLERMQKSLQNPERLAKTFALVLPSFMTYRFNELARVRGYHELDAPMQDMQEFGVAV